MKKCWVIKLDPFFKKIIFIYFWLCWVFVAAHRLSLVAVSGATLHCSACTSRCGGFSCCGAQAALGVRASVVAAHGLSSCGSWAVERRLSSCGSQALEHRLSGCGSRALEHRLSGYGMRAQ